MKKKLKEKGGILRCFFKILFIMRIAFFIIIISSELAFSADSYAQNLKFSFHFSDTKVSDILKAIEDQSEFIFFYQDQYIDLNRKVNLDIQDKRIEEVLDLLLAGTENVYTIRDRQIIIGKSEKQQKRIEESAKRIPDLLVQPIQNSIRGKVLDMKGLPLPGATVVIKGTTIGTVTDVSGSYMLNADKGDILKFSFIGYRPQEIEVKDQKVIDAVLSEELQGLNEVVVVGYGTQKKIHVTGAVAQVEGEELASVPSGNITAMLQGRLPGLVSKQTSGQPGADGADLYIRGLGSGDGQALIVVDGIIRTSFGTLMPEEIESVTILKDASAAAIYGVRSSGGVILVTTKKGTIQKPTLTYNSSISISQNTRFPKFLDGPGYTYWYNKAEELDGVPESSRRFTADEIDRITNGDPQGVYANTDWFDLLFDNHKPTYSNIVTYSGGTDQFKYFASLGAFNQEGIMQNTSYDRYNMRVNIDGKITNDFSVSMEVAARRIEAKEPGLSPGVGNTYASILSQAMMSYPYLPITKDGMPVGSYNSSNGNQNPLAARDLSGKNEIRSNILEVNFAAQYDIPVIKGLSLKLSASYDKSDTNKKVGLLPYQLYVWNQATRVWSIQNARHSSSGIAQVNQWFTETEAYTVQPSLSYNNDFEKHKVGFLFLYEYNRAESTNMSGGRRGYPIEDIMDLTYGEEVIDELVKGTHGLDRRAGYVARFNYSYADRYLAEFTARYDGTPYLPGEYRWGLFPAVSLGWRISEEDFFNIEKIDNLKLRMSAGRLGSDRQLDYSYSYFSTMSLGADPVVLIGDKLGKYLSLSRPANTNLRWQVTDSYNIGADMMLWKGLLGIEFDVFYSLTRRKLASPSDYPPSMGTYYPAYINYGKHDNKGFELVLTHENKINDFNYNLRGNISWARNKVLQSTEDPNLPEYSRSTGKRMGQHSGFLAEGLFQTEEEIENSPVYGPTLPGDIKLKDINGDGKITWEQDATAIGKSAIPELMFSLNMSGEYKGFDFGLYWQGATIVDVALAGLYSDRYIMDNTFYTKPFYVDGNAPVYLLENSWTPDNTDAKYPRLGIESRDNGGKFSSWWIVDGSYLRLKTAQLGYSIPLLLTRKIGVEKLRVYVSGSNLLTLTKSGIKYLDPEMPNVNQGYYPQQKLFEFGINVTF
jgi:TonB-linked SusC/RagA family outer membrane protein